jgi:O-antigen ligase
MTAVARWADQVAFACVLLLTALAGLSGGGLTPAGLLGLRLLLIVGAGTWLFGLLHGHSARLPRSSVWWVLAAGLLWSVLSTALDSIQAGAVQPRSLEAWTDLLAQAAAVGLGCALVRSRKRRRLWLTVLLASALVLGLYGVLQFAGLGWTERLTAARVSATYFNSNHYAGFLALLTPLVFSLSLAAQGRRRAWGLALAGLLTLNLLLAFSWALVPVLLACCWLLWRQIAARRRALWVVLTLGGAALALGAVAFSPQLAPGPLTARLNELGRVWVADSLGSRLLIWRGSGQIVLASPLVGAAPGNFGAAFTRYRAPTRLTFAEGLTHSEVNYAHSDLLQVAAETGIPGLLIWLAFWVLALRSGGMRSGGTGSLPAALRAGLLALLGYGLTDCNLTQIPGNALLAYLAAGVLIGFGQTSGQAGSGEQTV